jgi:uncharacterized zinc-type alcohol dehydrogenase-like protein
MSHAVKPTTAWAAASATAPLTPITIDRREPLPTDVEIEVLFCGICHSDLHVARNEWSSAMPTTYPIVPGHEIVGRVTRVGASVTDHQEGDVVGVGCLVESDGTCANCKAGFEQFCMNAVFTYGAPDAHLGGITQGGYSKSITVDQRFVLRVPSGLDPAGAAPLLCAGITTYSPLRRAGVTSGMKVGVVGLGGLGHMGVKFAKAFGAHVAVFTTSPKKREDALRLGATEVIVSTDAEAMQQHAGTFDFILDTVSADHDINAYMAMLKPEGRLTLVGAPSNPLAISAFSLIMGNRTLGGSNIGGIRETQEMLDFCGKHGITADVEVIAADRINEAYERLLKSDVKYRFSIDVATM